MVIEGVNCEISFIPITKEFHWFNDFVVIFTVLGTFECFLAGQLYETDEFYTSCSKTSEKVVETSCKFMIAPKSLEYHFIVIRK